MLSKYSSYILCFLISILVVTLYVNDFSPLKRLQWQVQDILYSFRGEKNFSSDIILVNIDDQTLSQYGQWPWNRDKIADLLAAVGGGQPKTVVFDLILEPDTEQDTLGYTEVMAGQMSWMKNVIIPFEFTPAEFRNQKISNPKFVKQYSVDVNNSLGVLDESAALLARKIFLPPDQICQYSSGLGFKYNVYDDDREIRWSPLVIHYEGYYYPSTALLAAAHQLGVEASSIMVNGGRSVKVGKVEIPTNKSGELFINYNKQGESFRQISAADILNELIDPSIFAGKLAIISISSKQIAEYYSTPVSSSLGGNEIQANVIENIIHANFIKRIDTTPGADMLTLFGLGILFAFILPRVSLLYRFVILMVCFFVLANLNFVLFNFYKILAQPLYLGLELFLLLLASPILDNEFLSNLSIFKGKIDGSGTTKLPKIDLKQNEKSAPQPTPSVNSKPAPRPHQTNAEFEKTTAADQQGNEDSNQTIKADSSETITTVAEKPDSIEHSPISLDTGNDEVIDKTEIIQDSTPLAPPPPPQQPQENISSESDRKLINKSLGRYKILEVLGQGAMGTVYKSIDPAINRNVALKTIRLDFVSDPEEMNELKERLFREARAAGMLSHPNIVTIYDVGTENNLQYIAMEYLEGQTLEDMIHRKVKFNYRIITEIITQICSALDYAHNQGIVHRDIKPANIMILKDYVVKVMDYGIARIDSTSMTRTGIAMGTPNYISPEQLQGRTIDNRCDIFSLGVVMYEMLLNRRPFNRENLTSLIYNIVNNKPEMPSSIDQSIPTLFDRVIDRALQKDPEERFQKASEISSALADFIDSFSIKKSTMV